MCIASFSFPLTKELLGVMIMTLAIPNRHPFETEAEPPSYYRRNIWCLVSLVV